MLSVTAPRLIWLATAGFSVNMGLITIFIFDIFFYHIPGNVVWRWWPDTKTGTNFWGKCCGRWILHSFLLFSFPSLLFFMLSSSLWGDALVLSSGFVFQTPFISLKRINCSGADCSSKTHKEIPLLLLLWGLSGLSLSQGGWTPSATSLLRHEDLEIWKRSGVVWRKMDLCSKPCSLWYAHCRAITKDLHRIYIFLRGRSVEREQSAAMTDESIWRQRLPLSHK